MLTLEALGICSETPKMLRLLIILTITASCIEAGRYNKNPNNANRNPGNPHVNRPYVPKSNNGRYHQNYYACPCDSVSCENGGECLIDYESWNGVCCCAEGFTGDNCEIEIDACTTNPCENDGTCQVGADDQAVCTCAPNFAGPTCTVDCTASVTCPSGLEKIVVSGIERCYFISTDVIESWAAAVKACSDQGLILWEPNTNDEVTAVAAELASGNYWVGVSDVIQEGNVIFSTSGEPFTLTTDENTEVKDCLEFRKNSMTFEFRACHISTRRYVCEQQSVCG